MPNLAVQLLVVWKEFADKEEIKRDFTYSKVI